MRQIALLALLILGCTTLARAQTPTSRPAINPALPTLWIAGDSTAASGNRGWGMHLTDYLDTTKINVVNRAVGGQSSRTFITQGAWGRMLAQFKPGDIVLIQFGHNDISAINDARVARGVIQTLGEETQEIENLATKQHEVVHTFGWYMRKMISETKEKGAIPVVVSMTVRNMWNDGKVERGAGEMAKFAIQIAKDQNVEYVDLNHNVANLFDSMGEEKVAPLFSPDKTHTTVEGADFNASHVAAGLKSLKTPSFDAFLTDKGKALKPE